MPKLDKSSASNLLKELQGVQAQVNANTISWDNYFKSLDDGQKYLIDFVQKTDLQKASTEDLIKTNEAARQSALDHNAALKQQTLGAKAAAIGLNALKTVGNTLAYTFIAAVASTAVNAIITKITEIVNAYADGVKKIGDLYFEYIIKYTAFSIQCI